jgi:hypothetical protein
MPAIGKRGLSTNPIYCSILSWQLIIQLSICFKQLPTTFECLLRIGVSNPYFAF